MTTLRTHLLSGVVGATIDSAGEGFDLNSGADGGATYAAGGPFSDTCMALPSGWGHNYQDNLIAGYVGIYVMIPAAPTGNNAFAIAYSSTGAAAATLTINSARKLTLNSSWSTVVATSTTALATGTWYWVQWQADASGQSARLWTVGGGSAIETISGGVAGTAIAKYAFGHPNEAIATGAVNLAKISLADSWPDPYVPNVAPTAAFTSTASGLTVAFDGTGSSDSDGTIASYAWNFGDSGTGTGLTTSHTYSTTGTYTASLTVTDNGGATGSVSHDVTVTAPPSVPVVRGVIVSGVEVAASVRGVIVSGAEVSAAVREVIDDAPPAGGGALPLTIPFTV